MGVLCQIVFPPEQRFCIAGHPVTGIIRYRLNKPTRFESIKVHLKGKGKCSWSEGVGDQVSHYSGKEVYVKLHRNILLNRDQNAGEYNVPFEFILPSNIPSSYKDKKCTILYKIVVKFKKPALFFSTQKFHTELSVLGALEPCSQEPTIIGLTKTPFSLSSPKTMNMRIEIKKALVKPGERIKFNFMVNNHTNLTLTGIKVKLMQVTTYISNRKSKKIRRKVVPGCVTEYPMIKGNSGHSVIGTMPTFPNLCTIQHSKILKNQFRLKVKVIFPFPHRDACVEIPVVIGERSGFYEQKVPLNYYFVNKYGS